MSINGNKHCSPPDEQFALVTEFGRQVVAEIDERFVLLTRTARKRQRPVIWRDGFEKLNWIAL